MEQQVTNQPQTPKDSASLMHDFNTKDATSMSTQKVILSLLVVLLLGLSSGFGLAKVKGKSTGISNPLSKIAGGTKVESGKTYGSTDTEIYKDNAEGKIENGGFEGEGQYHLTRPGGDSQTVYLTSSTVDLSQFIGHKVKIWGQTQKAQKVAWLMDVGGVKVLE